jgi:hypothetical protein
VQNILAQICTARDAGLGHRLMRPTTTPLQRCDSLSIIHGGQLFPPGLQCQQIDQEEVAPRFQLGNAAPGRFVGNAFGETLL